MKRFIAAVFAGLLIGALSLSPAKADFVAGFLAQCTAVTATSCTEQTATGYARQPISFSKVSGGKSTQAVPYYYAPTVGGTINGHAVYDALTNGNLILVIPYAAAYSIPSGGDHGDVGSIQFTVTAAAGFPAAGLNITYQIAAVIGTTTFDGSNVTAASALSIQHGNGFPNYGDADMVTRQVTETTGFTYTTPAGVTSVNFKGAGTLATGALVLPIPLSDGTLFKLTCSITITALTTTAQTPATIVGTAPTTCGAGTSHELQYFAGDTTWHLLF